MGECKCGVRLAGRSGISCDSYKIFNFTYGYCKHFLHSRQKLCNIPNIVFILLRLLDSIKNVCFLGKVDNRSLVP